MTNPVYRKSIYCEQCHGTLTIPVGNDGKGKLCSCTEEIPKDITTGLDRLIEDMMRVDAVAKLKYYFNSRRQNEN